MTERRFLTDVNVDEVVSFCCQNTPVASSPENHLKLALLAIQYIKEDFENHRHELDQNCSAREYRGFIDSAIYRMDIRIRAEHKDESRGFSDVPITELLASLLAIWRFIRDWLNRP